MARTKTSITGIGARGFEGQLTMAPEVRAGASCSYASDMFSFGGLCFFAMLHSYCLSFGDADLPSQAGSITIPDTCDPELHSVLESLLAREPAQRLTASLTMSHCFFSAAGAKARQEALDRLEQLRIMQEEMVRPCHIVCDDAGA
jgi:serine/threonine protein kinase